LILFLKIIIKKVVKAITTLMIVIYDWYKSLPHKSNSLKGTKSGYIEFIPSGSGFNCPSFRIPIKVDFLGLYT